MLTLSSIVRAVVLQHAACEPAGVYGEVLDDYAAVVDHVRLDAGDPVPEVGAHDAVIVMGGPMGVGDRHEHPWLDAEQALIRDAVRSRAAVFGVCLGAQLLAASLGGRVYPGDSPEIGVFPVELTPEAVGDPIFSALPSELLAMHWHSDTFDLPEGAVRLAGSRQYPNQAFRVGERAYGLQFHFEVWPGLIEEWPALPDYARSLARVGGEPVLRRVLDELERNVASLHAHARDVFGRWLQLCAEPSAARRAGSAAVTGR